MDKLLQTIALINPALKAANAVEQLGEILLDTVEEFVQRTDNTIDDKVILPMITGFRVLTGINERENEENEA